MSLHYRAVWRDDRADLIQQALAAFRRWTNRKGLSIEVPPEGSVVDGDCEIEVRRATDGDASVLQLSLIEQKKVGSSTDRWKTTTTCMSYSEEGWVWIDVERESEDLFGIPPVIAAPNLAGDLLRQRNQNDARVNLGPTPLRVASRDIDTVLAALFDPDRAVPMVLFSADPSISPKRYGQRVKRTAKDLAGCADVRMLTADSEDAFNAALPDISLKVYRGGARIYVPPIAEADPQPYRHRYILSDRLTSRAGVAARKIAQMVMPMMLAKSPPVVYRTRLKPLIDGRDWQEIALDLDRDLNGPDGFKHQNENLKMEKAIAYEEATHSEGEIDRLVRRNELLRVRLRELSESPEVVELAAEEVVSPSTCQDAVSMAKLLPHIEIHLDAPVEIDRLDASEDSELWARRIWRHLNSLNAYAQDKGPGFPSWCENSGHDRVIGTRFIAMSESQSVMNNPDLRRHRRLPIDRAVERSGFVEMQAHLKPVQGGGIQIPRIYFHDDTKGHTGKVHIGFIGPHDRMPNLSSD